MTVKTQLRLSSCLVAFFMTMIAIVLVLVFYVARYEKLMDDSGQAITGIYAFLFQLCHLVVEHGLIPMGMMFLLLAGATIWRVYAQLLYWNSRKLAV